MPEKNLVLMPMWEFKPYIFSLSGKLRKIQSEFTDENSRASFDDFGRSRPSTSDAILEMQKDEWRSVLRDDVSAALKETVRRINQHHRVEGISNDTLPGPKPLKDLALALEALIHALEALDGTSDLPAK